MKRRTEVSATRERGERLSRSIEKTREEEAREEERERKTATSTANYNALTPSVTHYLVVPSLLK